MEVAVSDLNGLPEGSVISIRTGTTRRQAPISALGNQAFRFPPPASFGEPLKVDLLLPVASKRLVLNPSVENYRMDLATVDGRALSFSLRIRGEASVEQAAGKTAGGALTGNNFDGALRFSEAAACARQYLEQHGLLPYFQGLLHVVIQEKPENPYRYLWEQLGMLVQAEGTGVVKSQVVEDKTAAPKAETPPPLKVTTASPSPLELAAPTAAASLASPPELRPAEVPLPPPMPTTPPAPPPTPPPTPAAPTVGAEQREGATAEVTGGLSAEEALRIGQANNFDAPPSVAMTFNMSPTPKAANTSAMAPSGSQTTRAAADAAEFSQMKLKIEGMDYDQLISNPELTKSVKTEIKRAVLEEAGNQLKESSVHVDLSKGSVVATIKIFESSTASLISSSTLTNAIASKVSEVPGINAVKSGPIIVSKEDAEAAASPPALEKSVTVATTPTEAADVAETEHTVLRGRGRNGGDGDEIAGDASDAAEQIPSLGRGRSVGCAQALPKGARSREAAPGPLRGDEDTQEAKSGVPAPVGVSKRLNASRADISGSIAEDEVEVLATPCAEMDEVKKRMRRLLEDACDSGALTEALENIRGTSSKRCLETGTQPQAEDTGSEPSANELEAMKARLRESLVSALSSGFLEDYLSGTATLPSAGDAPTESAPAPLPAASVPVPTALAPKPPAPAAPAAPSLAPEQSPGLAAPPECAAPAPQDTLAQSQLPSSVCALRMQLKEALEAAALSGDLHRALAIHSGPAADVAPVSGGDLEVEPVPPDDVTTLKGTLREALEKAAENGDMYKWLDEIIKGSQAEVDGPIDNFTPAPEPASPKEAPPRPADPVAAMFEEAENKPKDTSPSAAKPSEAQRKEKPAKKKVGYIGAPALLEDTEINAKLKSLIVELVRCGHEVTVGLPNKQLADGTNALVADMAAASATTLDVVLVAPGGPGAQAEAEKFAKHTAMIYCINSKDCEYGKPRWLIDLAGDRDISDLSRIRADEIASKVQAALSSQEVPTELWVGAPAVLRREGSQGRVLQRTTTDVQLKMEDDGSERWVEIEELKKAPSKIPHDLVEGECAVAFDGRGPEGVAGIVLRRTTTDVMLRSNDGIEDWHAIEQVERPPPEVKAVVLKTQLTDLKSRLEALKNDNSKIRAQVEKISSDMNIVRKVNDKAASLLVLPPASHGS